MTDRERLIKLIKTPHKAAILRATQSVELDEDEILADYLLANGVIVPPCKVGQTVYHRHGYSFVIEKIEVFDNKMLFRCGNIGTDDYMAFYADEIGTDVFLTHEEQKKHLQKRGGNS